MVLAGREEEVGVPGVELDLVDGVAVAHVVLDAGLRGGVEDAHDAARPRHRQQREVTLLFIRPGASVECFVYLQII